MNKVIAITGASSGFGALTARALAVAGHRVYAGMRETAGRNSPQVASLTAFAKEHGCDLRWVDSMFSSTTPGIWLSHRPFGKRPFRVHIDPADDGAEVVNGVAERVRAELLRKIGLADVLKPASSGAV